MADRPGFMIYADEWSIFAEDYSPSEAGEMLLSLLEYFNTGAIAVFNDRGMKQFFRQAIRTIDRDAEAYRKRCIKNAYSRYCGVCDKQGTKRLEFDEWYKTIYNNRQQSSTTVNDFNQHEHEHEYEHEFECEYECEGERESRGETQRETEDYFERKRQAALAALGYE